MSGSMSQEEFEERLKQIPGVKIEGDTIYGIRLLTEAERVERSENAEKIRLVICAACGADERSCGSGCNMMVHRVHKKIAAMIPPGTKVEAHK